jgi:hypothetical protein
VQRPCPSATYAKGLPAAAWAAAAGRYVLSASGDAKGAKGRWEWKEVGRLNPKGPLSRRISRC